MATTKKTPAKKAAAPKKTTKVKAPVAEQVECIPKDPEPIKEPPVEMVSYVIPKDPGMESDDQFFEININGINYRFKRGEALTHPRDFYEFIAYKLSLREHIDPLVAEFKDKSKKLN